MTPTLKLYQIQYDEHTSAKVGSGFLTFDCRGKVERDRREIAHLMRFYDEVICAESADDNTYYALLSPKFNAKSGLTYADVDSFIKASPVSDVYLFNVFPTLTYSFNNMWEQGVNGHGTELLRLANALFTAAGIDFDVTAPHRNDAFTSVYCNYWVANKAFYDAFVPFLKQLDSAIGRLNPFDREQIFSQAKYVSPACYYPFLFERMIAVFLLLNKGYKVTPYVYNQNVNGVKRNYFIKNWQIPFNEWEKNQTDMNVTFAALKKLQELQSPLPTKPRTLFYRLLRSALKRINVIHIRRFMLELMPKVKN